MTSDRSDTRPDTGPDTGPDNGPDTGLDPRDWDAFRTEAHALLDTCIDRLANARTLPWRPVPEAVRTGYDLPDDGAPVDLDTLRQLLENNVLPYATGNTHPRFWGWVHGTGLAEGLLSEVTAATMNANCGGRDHGMTYVERAVIDWSRRQMGFPESASGLLVAGTSQATVLALAAARLRALGPDVRARGQDGRRLVLYAGAGAHNAIRKAVELLGIGHDNLRRIPEGPSGMDLDALAAHIAQDRETGAQPFAVVGTAGSVDLGRFDDLHGLADIAAREDLWLHVDAAFGAWIRLAEPPWRALGDGLERADSLACDFHKWMYVPYDCGLILMRNAAEHRAAFAARPSYLAPLDQGLAGGDPWYCDYGIDLSRGNRALKVWTALRRHGTAGFGAAITANCRAAAQMGQLVDADARMALAAPVVSNLCVFTAAADLPADTQSALNTGIAQALQMSGQGVFSTTRATLAAGEVTCLRAAITNHRTTPKDITAAVTAVVQARAAQGTQIGTP